MKRSIQRVAARERKRRIQKEQSRRDTTTEGGTAVPVVAVVATTTTIDDCLAELESSLLLPPPPPPSPPTTVGDRQQKEQTTTDDRIDRNDDDASDVAKKLPRQQQYCTINAAMIRDKVEIWNETFRAWQKAASSFQKQHNKGPPIPPAGLVPNFDVEMTRHFKVQELSTFLLEASMVVVVSSDNAAAKSGGTESTKGLKMPAFERWLLDAKLEDQAKWRSMMGKQVNAALLSLHDPVLPKEAHIGMEASKRLVEEVIECSNKTRLDARHLVKDLCRRSNAAYQHIQQLQRAMAARTGLWKRGDRIEMKMSSSSSSSLPASESNGNDKDNKDDRKKTTITTTTTAAAGNVVVVTLIYHRPKQWKKPFCVKLNQSHYEKLKSAFLRVHNNTSRPAIPDFRDDDDRGGDAGAALASTFHLLLMTMLLRYSSLSGGHLLQDLRGGGMQGAVHEEVFQVLASSSGDSNDDDVVTVCLEGFASPFNCCWPAFGSAFFHDLDWHFGGVGNFFDLPLAAYAAALAAASSNDNQKNTHTMVQANPPFTPGVMSYMSEHILRQVELADDVNIALTFVVICATPGDPRDPNMAVAKRYGGDAVRPLLQLLPKDKEEEEKEEDANNLVQPPLSHHIVLTAREHGYVEGAQHLRPTRYKESPYDTSVIIVSSQRARTLLDSSKLESLEQRLREAFASRHRQETAARRPKDKTSHGE
jgi:phosphorylated CTD-interacting factor 1